MEPEIKITLAQARRFFMEWEQASRATDPEYAAAQEARCMTPERVASTNADALLMFSEKMRGNS